MNIQIVAFVFGGLLLFIGVLGGGFEVKELKIPKVGVGVRVVSVVVGVVFICLGFGGAMQGNSQARSDSHDGVVMAGPPAAPPPSEAVDFTLTDQLGHGEISEQVTILVDGKNVGNLTVNEQYPDSRIMVTVPKPGQHSYTAEAVAVFNVQGIPMQYSGAGQGMINVSQGKIYFLRGSMTGSTWLVSIEEQQ